MKRTLAILLALVMVLGIVACTPASANPTTAPTQSGTADTGTTDAGTKAASTGSELAGEDKRLFLLLGTDMVLTLDQWKDPEEIFKLAYPVYVRREKDKILDEKILAKLALYKEKYGKMVTKLTMEPIEISSSQIRERIASGRPVSDFVPPSVEDYIKTHHLYGA